MKQDKKTFTATIRVDLRGLASLAGFLSRAGIHKENKSRLASYGLQLTFEGMAKRFPIKTHAQAIELLSKLGYGDMTRSNTLFHKALMRELARESLVSVSTEIEEDKIQDTKTHMAVKEAAQQSTGQQNKTCTIVQDFMKTKEYLDTVDEEEILCVKPTSEDYEKMQVEGFTTSETPPEITPTDITKADKKQTKELTPEDLKEDQLKGEAEAKALRDGFASGMPEIAEDETEGKDENENL